MLKFFKVQPWYHLVSFALVIILTGLNMLTGEPFGNTSHLLFEFATIVGGCFLVLAGLVWYNHRHDL